MKGRILLSMALVMVGWTVPSLAAVRAGVTTYRVQLVLYPGDDGAAVAKRLAAMYRGTVETAVDGDGSFTIALSPATADLMGRDPAVQHLELGETTPAPMVTTAAALETTAVATPWKLGDYQYDGSGNIRRIGADFYAYDNRNRLVLSADASQSTLVPKQSYTYDNFGNITSIATAGSGVTTMGVNTSSNRVTSVTAAGASTTTGYDQAGNMTRYGTATYAYDALDMLTRSTFDAATCYYVYSASDERIGTIEVSAAGTRSEWTIRDASGQVLRRFSKESTGEWKWQEDYIYRGSQMLAAEVSDSTKTRHFHLDHLGTPRLITGNGGVKLSRNTYHPFGMEIASTSTSTSTSTTATAREKKQFTGHERDAESLDYMHARFYAPYMGRFLSVDPVLDAKTALMNPQAWNRYAYVMNNPLNRTDPDGKCSKPATKNGEVGVCIEGFIATSRVGMLGLGHGDGRTFAANDRTKTNRVQVQLVINPQTGKIVATTRAAISTAGVGPVTVSGQGTATTTLSNATRQSDGTITFTSQTTATNGLANKLGAPKDSIDFKFNIAVKPDGQVGLNTGGRTDGYPSVGVYAYEGGSAVKLFENPENRIRDLAAPMEVAVPAVPPQ
jgi:RHS repeat-associated protein